MHTGSSALGLQPGRLWGQDFALGAAQELLSKPKPRSARPWHGPVWDRDWGRATVGRLSRAGGETGIVSAMASLPAGRLGLVQLEQSRGLSYDFLSPNLCCSGPSSSALAVPPCTVTAETAGLGRLCKAALIEAHLRGKKKTGLKCRGSFVV